MGKRACIIAKSTHRLPSKSIQSLSSNYQNWFEFPAAEHRAVRETVGMYDVSSFGKFRVWHELCQSTEFNG